MGIYADVAPRLKANRLVRKEERYGKFFASKSSLEEKTEETRLTVKGPCLRFRWFSKEREIAPEKKSRWEQFEERILATVCMYEGQTGSNEVIIQGPRFTHPNH